MKPYFDFIALALSLFGVLLTASCANASDDEEKIQWPEGKIAALSLTYDDALQSHLDTVVPALDKYGLKATFYITVASSVFTEKMKEWRSVAKTGHELGNHSLFHPCLGLDDFPDRDWVAPERDLNNYTVPQIVQELSLANAILKSVDEEPDRSYAYPCGEATAGGLSYVDAIKPLFSSARSITGHPASINDAQVSIYALPTYGGEDRTGSELIEMVKSIKTSGGYGTVTFHGVGGDYLSVPKQAHDDLLRYLSTQEEELWIDTVQTITTYVKTKQK